MKKTFLLFVAAAVRLAAQGFAPDSLENCVMNQNSGQNSASVIFTASTAYSLKTSGIPLSEPSAYTYQKTGPNVATYAENNGIVTANAVFTFTTANTGTFRATSPNTSTIATGTFTFAQIPQLPARIAPGLAGAAPLVNISTRAVLAGGAVLTPGFVVGGSVPRRVLVRAVGPGLAPFGVAGAAAALSLAVFNGAGAQIGANAGWPATLAGVFRGVGAFALADGSADSALLLTLAPGNYTARITGAGEVLAEIYFVD